MKPTHPELRRRLAAEYVLGTLHGGARRRFELWLRSDPALRREVTGWEQRLVPLATTLPEIAPDPALWRRIEARIDPSRVQPKPAWWSNLAFWRWSSFATAGFASLLFAYVVATPALHSAAPPDAMVVVMGDSATSQPSMTVAWTPEGRGKTRLRIRVIGHAEMAPDTAWELWMLPDGNKPPRSLGLINTHETQVVDLPEDLRGLLNRAAGMAMSLEPAGGSRTGAPTGPVLASGKCVKI